jgi:hypothetical protein
MMYLQYIEQGDNMNFDNICGTGIIIALLIMVVGFTKSDTRYTDSPTYVVVCEGDDDIEMWWD